MATFVTAFLSRCQEKAMTVGQIKQAVDRLQAEYPDLAQELAEIREAIRLGQPGHVNLDDTKFDWFTGAPLFPGAKPDPPSSNTAANLSAGASAAISSAASDASKGTKEYIIPWGIPITSSVGTDALIDWATKRREALTKEKKMLNKRNKNIEKKSIVGEALDAYEKVTSDPVGATAMTAASTIPGVGTALAVPAVAQDLRKGRYWSAAGNTAAGVASMLPVPGAGPVARTAVNALRTIGPPAFSVGGQVMQQRHDLNKQMQNFEPKFASSLTKLATQDQNFYAPAPRILPGAQTTLGKDIYNLAKLTPYLAGFGALGSGISGGILNTLTGGNPLTGAYVGGASGLGAGLGFTGGAALAHLIGEGIGRYRGMHPVNINRFRSSLAPVGGIGGTILGSAIGNYIARKLLKPKYIDRESAFLGNGNTAQMQDFEPKFASSLTKLATQDQNFYAPVPVFLPATVSQATLGQSLYNIARRVPIAVGLGTTSGIVGGGTLNTLTGGSPLTGAYVGGASGLGAGLGITGGAALAHLIGEGIGRYRGMHPANIYKLRNLLAPWGAIGGTILGGVIGGHMARKQLEPKYIDKESAFLGNGNIAKRVGTAVFNAYNRLPLGIRRRIVDPKWQIGATVVTPVALGGAAKLEDNLQKDKDY
jgi:hypothetical protein